MTEHVSDSAVLKKPGGNAFELPLMEEFYSIQGEGFFQGSAAYFIRLGGCDVGCVWCDVKESWDAAAHPSVAVSEMAERAKESGTSIVVVTGGEPAMYNLDELTQALHTNRLKAHLETSGAYPASGTWDWVCLSPKKFMRPDPSWFSLANELKVVVYNRSDFAWAEEFAAQVNKKCKLFLQPEWSKEQEVLPSVIDYVKQFPRWSISLQVHKYMNVR